MQGKLFLLKWFTNKKIYDNIMFYFLFIFKRILLDSYTFISIPKQLLKEAFFNMLKIKVSKWYKAKRLYVCHIYLATEKYMTSNRQIDYSLHFTSTLVSTKILYATAFGKKMINPITGRCYISKEEVGIYDKNFYYEIKCNVSNLPDFDDKIYNRSCRHLTLSEIICWNKLLEEKNKN